MKKNLASKLLIFIGITFSINAQALDTYENLVDPTGNIAMPADYEKDWTYLGSYFVKNEPAASMSDNGPAKSLSFDAHTVYTQPESAAHYRKHGRFPDGAVLIKDISGTTTERLTTGEARYVDSTKVIFVMVKDEKGRFPGNKAWGEGWGWALFNPGNPTSQTKDWKGEGFNNCFGCHLPVKHQDWVYTQGYKSVLKK